MSEQSTVYSATIWTSQGGAVTLTSSTPAPPERDEHLIRQLTDIHDFCRRGDVDPGPVMPAIERVVKQIGPLRDAAKDMNQRQRRVLGDALGKAIREGLE